MALNLRNLRQGPEGPGGSDLQCLKQQSFTSQVLNRFSFMHSQEQPVLHQTGSRSVDVIEGSRAVATVSSAEAPPVLMGHRQAREAAAASTAAAALSITGETSVSWP